MESVKVRRAAELLEQRLRHIEDERLQLEAGLSVLANRAGVRQQRGSNARASRGQRQREVLAFLDDGRHARPADIADALGISSNQVSGVLAKLREDGTVRRFRGGAYGRSTGRAATGA